MEKQSMPSEGQLDCSIEGTCSCGVSRGISKLCSSVFIDISTLFYIAVLCSCESLCTVAKQLFFATENQFRTIVCSCEAVKVIGDHSSESNARLATGIPAKTLPHRSPLVTHGSRPMRAQC